MMSFKLVRLRRAWDEVEINTGLLITEKWCQERAGISPPCLAIIQQGDSKEKGTESIPASFLKPQKFLLTTISVIIISKIMKIVMLYHAKEERIPFNLTYFDKITKGLPNKILTSHLWYRCRQVSIHVRCARPSQGKRLYITLEMAEENLNELMPTSLTPMFKTSLDPQAYL